MKRFLCVMLLFAVGFNGCTFAEADIQVGMLREEIAAQWGEPVESFITLDVWESDGNTLMTACPYRYQTDSYPLTDYVLLDKERNYISGTIPAEDTLFHVYNAIGSTPVSGIPQVYDTGSGAVINTKITADGYIVRWQGDCPRILTDMYIQVYDCIELKYGSGRIFEYLRYLIYSEQ